MSRTEADWSVARLYAMKIRATLYDAISYMDCWPINMSEAADHLYVAETSIEKAIGHMNAVIGVCSHTWDEVPHEDAEVSRGAVTVDSSDD